MELFYNKRLVRWIAIGLIALMAFVQPSSDYVNSSGNVAKAAETETASGTDVASGQGAEVSESTPTPVPTPKLPDNLTYIKDVRLFHGPDWDAATTAAWYGGYKFVNKDLNAGTEKSDWGDDQAKYGSGDVVLLGYKTTKNRSEAITSMKMAEMDTGYQMFDYDEIEKSMNTSMNYLAEDVVSVLAEVKKNVDNGDLYASKVKDALNLYYIPYMDNKGLGDVLFDNSSDAGKIAQILKRCNLSVSTSLLSNLTMGVAGTKVSGQEGDFASRIAKNSQTISEMKKSEYVTLDSLYKDDVKVIRNSLQNYANEIDPALKLYQESGGEMSSSFMDEHPGEAMSVNIYNQLNNYTMADGTGLGTYLLRLGSTSLKSKEDIRDAYPVVMAMSPGQLTMFSYTGVFDAVAFMNESSENMSVAEDVLAQTKSKIKDSGLSATKDGRLPIYPPGQDALYRSKVALTSEAVRSASARDEYHKLTQYDKDIALWDKVFEWSNRIIIFSMAACMLGSGISWVIAHTSAKWLLKTAAMQMFTKLGWPIRLLGNNMVTFIIMIVILIVWYVVLKLKENYNYYNPNLTEVPRYMYSVEKVEAENGKKENAYILYTPTYNGYRDVEWIGDYRNIEPRYFYRCDNYEDINYSDSPDTIKRKEEHNKELFSDFNARQGKKWNALYTTKDPNAGSPICAENVEDIFLVKTGEYNQGISGYKPFSSFGNDNPVNLNSNQYEDDLGGIYLYYKTEETILDPEAASILSNGKYVSDLVIVSEKKENDAKAAIKLKAGKYHFLDQNLTPDQGCFTFIGYSVTENIDDAIRDIRVDPVSTGNSMSGGYRRNDIGYAEVGSTVKGNMTLYQTAVKKGETDISDRDMLKYTEDEEDEEDEEGGTDTDTDTPSSTMMSYSGAPILADFKVVDSLDKAPVGYEPILLGSGGAALNFNTRYKSEKDKNRRYVYYQPAVSFIPTGTEIKEKKGVTYVYSDKEYISGIQAFVWGDTPGSGMNYSYGKFRDRIRSMGYTIYDIDINQKFRMYEDHEPTHTCYIGYATTRNPFRALADVRYYKGSTFTESLPSSAASAEGTYLAMDVHVFGDPPDIGYGDHGLSTAKGYCGIDQYLISGDYYRKGITDKNRKKRKFTKERVESWQNAKVKNYLGVAERVLYTLAADENHPALTPDDLIITSQSSAPAGMLSIAYMTNPYLDVNFDISPFQAGVHCYIKREAVQRGTYISGINVVSFKKPDKMSKMEDYFTYRSADDSIKIAAYGGCTGEVLDTNIGVDQDYAWYNKLDADSDPVEKCRKEYYYTGSHLDGKSKNYSYVGVSYTDDPDEALTGVIRYKYKGSNAPNRISVGGVKYYKAGDAVGDYYYYTTTSENSSPGMPITGISFDRTASHGDQATIRQVDQSDPPTLQQQLDAIDDDDDLQPYEKIRKKSELRKKAVSLKVDSQKGLYGHLKADISNMAISELFIGQGSDQNAAMKDAIEKGANFIYSYNTNNGVGDGKSAYEYRSGLQFGSDSMNPFEKKIKPKFVCIGYTLEPLDEEDGYGIYDILITEGKPYNEDGFEKDDCEYYPVSDVSLNAGTDGEELYMYCTYDESDKADSPITSLALSRGDSIPAGAGDIRYEYIMTDTGTKSNLNKGATTVKDERFVDNRLWLFAHRYDNTVKREALFDITDQGRKTIRMDVDINN